MAQRGSAWVERLISALDVLDQYDQKAAVYALAEIGDQRAVEPLRAPQRRGGWWKGANTDQSTDTKAQAHEVALAVAAALNKLGATAEAKEEPRFVIVFREGGDEPSAPEEYCGQVAKLAYGAGDLEIQGWRIAGVLSPISKHEANRLYFLSSSTGRTLPDWGAPIRAWNGHGPDGRNIVVLFFS